MNKKTFNSAELAENVDKVRKDNRLTKKQFAESIEMKAPNFSSFINQKDKSKSSITVEQLYRIATEYGVSTDELLGLTPGSKSTVAKSSDAKDIVNFFAYLISNDLVGFGEYRFQEPFVYLDEDDELHYEEARTPYPVFYFKEHISAHSDAAIDEYRKIIESNNGRNNYVKLSTLINASLRKIIAYYNEYLAGGKKYKSNLNKKLDMLFEELDNELRSANADEG